MEGDTTEFAVYYGELVEDQGGLYRLGEMQCLGAGGKSAGEATSIHCRTLTMLAAGCSVFRVLTVTRQGSADNLTG